MTPDELIEEYLEEDPDRPGLADVRVKNRGVHVWALIGFLQGNRWDVQYTAGAYRLSKDVVEAAIAFYQRYEDIIDSRIDVNTPPAA
jgi:uncharacterized protein (DUF433 family)